MGTLFFFGYSETCSNEPTQQGALPLRYERRGTLTARPWCWSAVPDGVRADGIRWRLAAGGSRSARAPRPACRLPGWFSYEPSRTWPRGTDWRPPGRKCRFMCQTYGSSVHNRWSSTLAQVYNPCDKARKSTELLLCDICNIRALHFCIGEQTIKGDTHLLPINRYLGMFCWERLMMPSSGVLTISSSLSREYWGVPSLGGLDTWRCRESPFPTVSRHNTKATLSCNRLESMANKRPRCYQQGEVQNCVILHHLLSLFRLASKELWIKSRNENNLALESFQIQIHFFEPYGQNELKWT